MKLFLVIAGGSVLFLFGCLNWRRGVAAALVMLIFEGAIRKWVVPQASQFVYFAKDVLLLGAYAAFYLEGDRRPAVRFGEWLNLLIGLSVTWSFFECFNPGTGSLVAGLFGWRAYVLYLPICFMLPSMFRSTEDLQRFLYYYLALALPVCALGVAQFRSPPESRWNIYAAGVTAQRDEGGIAVFGDDQFVRVTGTFSYMSGFAAYLIFTLAVMLPTLISARSKIWQAILVCALALVTGNIVMTGSRAPALGAAIILAGFLVLTILTGNEREKGYWWVYLLAGSLGIIATMFFFEKAVNALQQRTEGAWGESQSRLLAAVEEPWDYMGFAGMLGHGNGITQPAVSALRTTLHLPPPQFAYSSPTDAENSRVLMELGIPGFFLWYGLRVGLVLAIWRTRQRLQSPFLRQLALGGFLFLFYQIFTITMFGPTSNIYHWFMAGLILLLPKLDARPRPRPEPADARAGNRRPGGRRRQLSPGGRR
jgi:hypothetical protein